MKSFSTKIASDFLIFSSSARKKMEGMEYLRIVTPNENTNGIYFQILQKKEIFISARGNRIDEERHPFFK